LRNCGAFNWKIIIRTVSISRGEKRHCGQTEQIVRETKQGGEADQIDRESRQDCETDEEGKQNGPGVKARKESVCGLWKVFLAPSLLKLHE
jgi:hypothetical protein